MQGCRRVALADTLQPAHKRRRARARRTQRSASSCTSGDSKRGRRPSVRATSSGSAYSARDCPGLYSDNPAGRLHRGGRAAAEGHAAGAGHGRAGGLAPEGAAPRAAWAGCPALARPAVCAATQRCSACTSAGACPLRARRRVLCRLDRRAASLTGCSPGMEVAGSTPCLRSPAHLTAVACPAAGLTTMGSGGLPAMQQLGAEPLTPCSLVAALAWRWQAQVPCLSSPAFSMSWPAF